MPNRFLNSIVDDGEQVSASSKQSQAPTTSHRNMESYLFRSRKIFNRLLVIRYALIRLIKLQMNNLLVKHEINTTTKSTSKPTPPILSKAQQNQPPETLLTILLKLFLIICYFLASIGSLLLLVQLYSTQFDCPLEQNTSFYSHHAKVNIQLPLWTSSQNKSLHGGEEQRHKRSLDEDYSSSLEASDWSSQRIEPEEREAEISERLSEAPVRSSGERKRSNYSQRIIPVTDRILNPRDNFYPQPVTTSDNGWIPIVNNNRPVAQVKPQEINYINQPSTTIISRETPPPSRTDYQHDASPNESKFNPHYYKSQVTPQLDKTPRQPLGAQNQYPIRMNRINNFRHRQHRPTRMPRFNLFQNQPAKLYRRVLLCEKSLVSLEYVKHHPNLDHLYYDSDFNFDENSIDFDTNFASDPMYAAATSNKNNAAENNYQRMSNNISTSEDLLVASSDKRRTFNRRYSAPNHYDEFHLNDEDPLVGCDMWDLEKGLKNRKPPHFILRMAVRTDFETFRDAINRCRQLSEKNVPMDEDSSYRDGIDTVSTDDLMSLLSVKRGLIPGTKWCGLGDQATSYNDLGPKHRIDICCRAHDHCPIRLKPFRNDYGVLNIALYTKSHCDCDADFYRCLREARSKTADMLGNLYFNVMKLQCIREERVKVCREMRPIALGFERCVRYEDSPGKRVFRFTTPPVAY